MPKRLAFGRFGHGRFRAGRNRRGTAGREQAGLAHAFQFPDGFLKKMPQHFDVDFVAEIVAAHRMEEIRPGIVELQVIHFLIMPKQAAVIGGHPHRMILAFVNDMEQAEKILPARIGYLVEGGHIVVSRGDAPLREKAPVLAKSDENDAVDELLGDVNGLIHRLAIFKPQMLDELKTMLTVAFVKFIADFPLPGFALFHQFQRAGPLAQVTEQAAELEQAIKLAEDIKVAHLGLEGEIPDTPAASCRDGTGEK